MAFSEIKIARKLSAKAPKTMLLVGKWG